MATKTYPLPSPVKPSGVPYTGSHGATAPKNWESRNAVDLDVPVGTPVYAQAAGVIGDRIGSLNSSDPKMQGLRVHLVTANNEFYYAHLSKLAVKAGEHVEDGQLLGYTGKANGVAHLHFAAKNGDPETILAEAAVPGQAGSAPARSTSAPSAGAAGTAAPSTVPDPYGAPTPLQGGVGQPQALDPGTVQADFNPRVYAATWQKIAADPWAPPEAQQLSGMWQTAAGG